MIDINTETLDDLMCGYQIIQPKDKFRFSIDAVLLSHFVTIKNEDICVDFCSGSGVIAFLIAAHNKIHDITCVEIQSYFADLIKRSVELNNVGDKISVVCEDLSNSHELFGYGVIDEVTCNPPYLKNDTGEMSDDDSLNIARREVKTELKQVIEVASQILKNKGRFAMIHLAERADEIFSLMRKYNMPVKRARLIQSNIFAKPNLIMIEGIKNAKNSVDWMMTLNIYEGEEYSKEVKEIYGYNKR